MREEEERRRKDSKKRPRMKRRDEMKVREAEPEVSERHTRCVCCVLLRVFLPHLLCLSPLATIINTHNHKVP